MYGEGQEYMEQKEYKRAADVFTRLLNLIEESPDNKAIRESLILNILDAHMQAYEGIVDANGKGDVSQLKQGKATLQEYYKDFQSVHGDSVAVIAEIQTTATKLEQMLKDAEASDPPPPKPGGGEIVPPPPPPEERVVVQGNSTDGLGLIIGGVGLAVVGVGTGIMIPVGSSLGKTAESDYNRAQNAKTSLTDTSQDDNIAEANADGKTANAVLISGAVLTPLLLGGAVALIVIGARKRNNANRQAKLRPAETLTAAPSFDRAYGGFSLSGRF